MKTKLLLASVWLLLMGLTLPLFAASTPAADDGKWYYVKSQRFEAGPWWTFNPTTNAVVPGAFTATNDQKFTLVTTVTGKVTVKEFNGKLMTATDATGLFDATGAATGWTITPNTVNGINGILFPGENYGLHQGSSGWSYTMSSGWYDITDFCTFFFYDTSSADLNLNIAVDDAIEKKSASVIGTNPNQTPQAAHDAYLVAINTAKTTLGSTDATAIQNAINTLAAATTTFINAKINPFVTATPVADDGKWYYVKSQRFNTGGPWWTFGTKVIPGALTKTDNQKFTLVTAASGKVTIKEKTTGLLFTAANGAFDATGALTGWTLTPNTVNGIVGYAFPGENSGIHQNSSGANWELRSGYYSLGDNCTFFFYEVKEDVDLVMAIETALLKISSVSAGTTIGKTPQVAIDNFKAAINTAKLTIGSTNPTEIQSAIDVLTTATNTFGMAKIQPVEKSTAAAPIWYLIKNTNRGGKGATLYTNGWDAQMLCTTVPNAVSADGTSTGAAAPALKYLFRFEQKANADFQIVNAALPTGEVLQTASGGNSSQVIKYGTLATPTTTWKLNFLGNNATLGVDELTFVSSGVSTMFHAAGGTNYPLVSYTGGTGGASAWYVEKYTGDVIALFQPQYDALEVQYQAIADVAGNPVAPYALGSEPGLYNTTKFNDVKTAYAAMVNEKTTNGVASANMLQKFTDLTTAIAAFKASKVMPVAYGGIIVAGQSYTLKLVQPGSANDGMYLKNPRVDELAASKPQAAFSATIEGSSSAWKFVESTTAGKYLITSARVTNEYIDELGRTRAASEYGDNIWGTKTLEQNTITFVDGTTLLIVKIDQNSNYLYSGTVAAATLSNNASNWSTFKLEAYVPTAIEQSVSSEINVIVANRMLVVSGTTAKAQVYSITGSKVDATRALNAGIYIVKVENKTFKVSVK